jgi:hypothetical protein
LQPLTVPTSAEIVAVAQAVLLMYLSIDEVDEVDGDCSLAFWLDAVVSLVRDRPPPRPPPTAAAVIITTAAATNIQKVVLFKPQIRGFSYCRFFCPM